MLQSSDVQEKQKFCPYPALSEVCNCYVLETLITLPLCMDLWPQVIDFWLEIQISNLTRIYEHRRLRSHSLNSSHTNWNKKSQISNSPLCQQSKENLVERHIGKTVVVRPALFDNLYFRKRTLAGKVSATASKMCAYQSNTAETKLLLK